MKANDTTDKFRFTFRLIDPSQKQMVYDWVSQEHIKKWFHSDGLKFTLEDLNKFIQEGTSDIQHWISYDKTTPFGYLLTSERENSTNQKKDAITLDLFICNLEYIGKGLAVRMIHEFLMSQFSNITEVLIDPEVSNTRAVHVYEKAGFRIVNEFIAQWHPVKHYQMQLLMKDLVKKYNHLS